MNNIQFFDRLKEEIAIHFFDAFSLDTWNKFLDHCHITTRNSGKNKLLLSKKIKSISIFVAQTQYPKSF